MRMGSTVGKTIPGGLLPGMLCQLAVMTLPIAGAEVCVKIEAEVFEVDDRDELMNERIQSGDIITGTYIYDSATPDSNAAATVGDYLHRAPPNGISLSVRSSVFKTNPADVEFLVEIVNNHDSGGPLDAYLLRSYRNVASPGLSPGAFLDHISWQLDDRTATANTSQNLPTRPPRLSSFESIFGLSITGCVPRFGPGCSGAQSRFSVTAHVTSAVLCNPPPEGMQLPGNCNQDGIVDVSDAICVFGVLFRGQPAGFPCGDGSASDEANVALMDWQPDGTIDLSDGIGLLQFLFRGGPPPALGRSCVPIAECPDICG